MMTAGNGGPKINEAEAALLGSLVEGQVIAVFRWGVIVDLGLSHVGLIDALYIDDGDAYRVGDVVSGYLTTLMSAWRSSG